MRTGLRYDAEELLGREPTWPGCARPCATGRLTSIIGPGGIGKTRIAHVLAREATQSRVHFVELVGITSPDDVVAEVGAALGVRGSVTSRRTHTPAQRADIRGRIAQELDAGPTLLVLDNCEHVLEAVASLVAFLLVTARDLRVVTTSRAPLNIAAEHVVLLDQLAPADGAALFVRRARAARPNAELDPAASPTWWPGSTGCRWRSSSPPPGSAPCRSRSSASASRTASRCSAAATGPHRRGTRR